MTKFVIAILNCFYAIFLKVIFVEKVLQANLACWCTTFNQTITIYGALCVQIIGTF